MTLDRDPQAGCWRQAAGVAYGVARAVGVEVGSPLAGGGGQFRQVRGAAWSTLTRHLREPHAAGTPIRAWDTPHALQAGTWRAPVQFRRVSGADVLAQSAFDLPLCRPAQESSAPTPINVTDRAEPEPAALARPVETRAQAEAAVWTLWGRGTASGFDGRPKDDFSMDGNVFTGYLGLDYRLQPNVLLGLAVVHSQGDVDYETTDVTKGAVDLTLTSVSPYAHWSPRPGLGVWGLFGVGWGNL